MAEEQVPEQPLEEFEDSTRTITGSRPGTETNLVIQLIIGLLGTLIVAFSTFPLKSIRGLNYIYQVVNERGPVQYLELFMAFMVATTVFLKTRIVRTQLRSIADGPVPSDIDLTDDEQISNLRRELTSQPAFSWSIILNRIDRLLALWLGSKDIGRVASWAGSESDRDASASDSSYSNARVLIWAIPILGFIGTVLGLGSSVSSFSEFLSGAADLSTIKVAIGSVTAGLGTAFDTTLLALILSVFLMFPLASVQRKEETLFVEVDNYLDDTLISRLPSAEQQPIVIENLEDSIEAAFRRYIPDPDRYDEVFTRSIEKAASSVEERFSGLTQNYEVTLKELTGRLSESLTSVGESMQDALRQAMDDMRDQDQLLMTSRKQIAQDETDRMKLLLQEVQDAAFKASSEYQKSSEALQAKTQESLDKTLSAAQGISSRMDEVGKLAASIEDLLRIQQAVEQGLQGLAASNEFSQTLVDIRNHLAATDAFCDRLSKPRIITFEEEIV